MAEITREAIRVLCKEIGPVNTVRFINQLKRENLSVGGSPEDYRESLREIKEHKEGKVKLSKARIF